METQLGIEQRGFDQGEFEKNLQEIDRMLDQVSYLQKEYGEEIDLLIKKTQVGEAQRRELSQVLDKASEAAQGVMRDEQKELWRERKFIDSPSDAMVKAISQASSQNKPPAEITQLAVILHTPAELQTERGQVDRAIGSGDMETAAFIALEAKEYWPKKIAEYERVLTQFRKENQK